MTQQQVNDKETKEHQISDDTDPKPILTRWFFTAPGVVQGKPDDYGDEESE